MRRRSLRAGLALALALLAWFGPQRADADAPLTTLDYRVVGVALRPARATLAIPKNVPGSVRIELVSGGTGAEAADALAAGAIVEATLRGPSFPARRVVGLPNGELQLPPLPLVGDYSLDDLRLVDTATGATRLDGSPRSVPITVFDDVLVSRVTSRPLSIGEIEERGIFIDEANFRVLEFEVGFVLDGRTIPVKFPVVAPRFDGNVEVIPKAELEQLLAEAESANAELGLGFALPDALEAAGLDIEIQGVNFQFVDPSDGDDLELAVPPIPGLLVVPGRIGMLNQFFSVMLFTENAAPAGSGLSVRDLAATLTLPNGLDQRPGIFAAPGDDPLRFARVGDAAEIEPTQPVRAVGTDGLLGTADDRARLQPGDTGQAEFLVEGLKEGLHLMDITIDGVLDGLASPRRIRGFASGSVLVRNPKFSLAFTHPRTIRSQEPYTAAVTILNTSSAPANLVSVTLPAASLSGAIYEPGTPEIAELGTILPGQTKTAEFRLRAQRTGAITFSQLTSDSDIVGRFRLRMGVDERGVALSPDSLGYPDFAEDLRAAEPASFRAIERYLGQALSVATAAQLPAGVDGVSRGAINQRVVQIAEAGQRLRYGDTVERVLGDLLLDFQGARSGSPGLDQIWRETDAGRELREALLAALASAAAEPDAVALLARRAADYAGRGEGWLVVATDVEQWAPSLELLGARAELDESAIGGAAGFSGAPSTAVSGHWLASRPIAGTLHLVATANVAASELALLDLPGDGSGRLLRWDVPALPSGACLRAATGGVAPALDVDETCNGTAETTLAPSVTTVTEAAPAVLAVVQDETVLSGRPAKPCPRGDIANYGTVVAVLFSKPMTQASVDVPGAYRLEDGNAARSVQIQPGGRVGLLNLAQPIGTIVPRTLSVASDVRDPRGNELVASAVPVAATAAIGVAVSGLVVRGNGEPAAGVPVTLTMYDEASGFVCEPFTTRPGQVRTDADGRFHFDYVPAGIPYSVSATDTTGISADAEALILEASSDERLDRAKLLELANGSARDTLLEQFIVGGLSQAIAAAEGLDRALLRDAVEEGSARVGTEVAVALRFRGRGTVTGRVFESDGVTPAPNAAVNLFADPDSRELGRGVVADDGGNFAFFGVPLGAFTIEATSRSGQTRTVTGALAEPGVAVVVPVVLSALPVGRGVIEGRVLEAATGGGHAGARVFVGRFVDGKFENLVSVATADGEGFYRAERIPAGSWDLVAVSFDGKRRGERRGVGATANAVGSANVTLQGRTTVRGRVEFANGAPGGFALVAGGEAIVRADADGNFELSGVPTGSRSIEAAVEADPARDIEFTRLGSASLDVIPGALNFVVVRLAPAGRILGIVRDAGGNPVPNVDVSIPQDGGFLWVKADAQGRFEFPNLALDDYTVSAPAPPHEDVDVTGILETLSGSPSNDALQAAITSAFEIFTGVNNPLLNGEGLNFNPSRWGYEKTALVADGKTEFVEVKFLPEGTISGAVRNGQGVPIGARVRLTGIGPTREGDVGFQIRGERDSDPALGTFTFPGQALAGDFGVQAATPFFPRAISVSGQTSRIDPDRSGLVLQFPSENSVNGRIAGRVLAPGGALVANAKVKIDFGDLTIRSNASGVFDTQLDLPAFDAKGDARSYAVEAEDETTGLRGRSVVTLSPGITNQVDVQLLGKSGALRVRVLDGLGAPVASAAVEVQQGTFPGDAFSGATNASGELLLQNLFDGNYGVRARAVQGSTASDGATAVAVAPGAESLALVRLGATATLRGRFVAQDRSTPIAFAQIRIDGVGFAATDAQGRFELTGVPLRTHRVIGQDAVTGRLGVASVTLASAGEIRDVLLVERALGLVEGALIDGFGTGTVSGVPVTLSTEDGLSPSRTVTTDPGGRFAFPGTPPGALQVTARDERTQQFGSTRAVLPEGVARLEVDVAFAALTSASYRVFEPNGLTPADATVTIRAGVLLRTLDTDGAGRVRFDAIPLGRYVVSAQSRVAGQTRSSAPPLTQTIDVRPLQPEATLTLRGVGRVEGRLFASNGATPIALRAVELTLLDQSGATLGAQTGLDGAFAFDGVPLGAFRLVGRDGALAATDNGVLDAAGDVASVDLVLGPSGTVTGRLVSQDGTLPIASAGISIGYDAPSGALGRDAFRTGADGRFHFEAIPVGAFSLESFVPIRNGVLRLAGAVASDAQSVDLGDVRLDEEDPRVVETNPADGDPQVAIDAVIRIEMNEALDPATIDPRGIFVRSAAGASVASEVALVVDPDAGDARVLEIRPDAPLASETDYEVVVVDGDLLSAVGAVIAEGPRDRVGRALAAPFTMQFRTRDQDPPGLLSISPPNGTVQVDPRAVLRLSFDEPIAASGIQVSLTGPNGAVAGRTDVGVGARVVVFTPSAVLQPNASYSAQVSGVRDLAGNLAEGLPFVSSFATLDTLGPAIAQLTVAGTPVGGATVTVSAVLAQPEAGASVRMSADLVPFGASAPGVLALPFALPLVGSPIVRAIAIDRFGNEGPVAELPIAIGANQSPTVAILRVAPAGGAIASGSTATVRITAADDVRVATLRAAADGAATAPLVTTAGTPITLTIPVPASAGPGAIVTVHAEAIDSTQQSSGEQTLSVAVSDGTAPSASFVAPAAGASVVPGAPLAISVQGSDNFGVTRFEVAAEGAFTAAQMRNVTGTPGTSGADFSLDVPADLAGGDVTLRVRAFDAAGLIGEATRVLIAPDLRRPRLVELLPPDASAQSTAPLIAARFDEPIARASVTAARLQLRDAANAVVPAQSGFAEGDRVVTLTPLAALASGASFRVVLQGGITDVAGNAIANGDGTPLLRVEHAFTIGGAVLEAPLDGGRVIEGQSIAARVVADAGVGERAVAFLANAATARVLPADLTPQQPHVYQADFPAPTIAALGGNPLRVGAALALPGNLATQSGVAATASSNFDARFPASRAADGNLDTSWFSRRPAQPGEFVDVRLAQPATVGRVEIFGNRQFPDGFDVATGTVTLFDEQGGVLFTSGTIALPAPARDAAIDVGAVDGVARVRFTALGGDAGEWGLAEIAVRPVLRTNVATLAVFAAAGDEDGDGIPNGAELGFGTDPFGDDRALDDDADGLSNAQEFTRGTNPRNLDSDGDGLADGAEVIAGLDPLDADSDDDGLPDGEDVLGGPRVLAIEPAAGAIHVSVRPRLRVRFDEPLARASVTAASFALREGGATPVAATFVFSEGDRVVDLVPDAPLAFSTGYTLAIGSAVAGTDAETIRNTDGSDVTVPIERSFTTGVFGLTDPAGGASVRELSTLALAASGNASLGIASVRFEVNGAVVATDSAAPFTANFAAPAANVTSALSITAIAFDAGGVELARDTVAVSVVVGLDVASRVLGVPLGASRDLVLRLPVPRATALDVAIVSLDAAVASVSAASQTIPAGSTELRVPVRGVAEGATTLVASTLEDQVVIAASVSALAAGSTVAAVASPVGVVVVPFPAAGDVIVPAASARTVTLRLLDAPAATDTVFVVTSSDPSVASIAGPVVVHAGSTEATFEITTGAEGTAVLTLVRGDDGRELRVISGAPSAANTPPVFAPPIGAVIVPFPSAGDVIVPVSSTRTVTLRILETPAAIDTELTITSSDPSVASIAGPVVVHAGSTEATFEITTGAEGTAVLTLVGGDDGRELRVISGAPSAANTPPVFAPPIGAVIVPFPSAGDVIVPVSSTRTVTLRILETPAAIDTELTITSSDPSVASIAGPVVVHAGSTEATFEITTGAEGTAVLTLVGGDDGRELRVISGAPSAANTPPVFAPPIGAVIVPFPSAGDVIVPVSSARTVTLRILSTPAAADTELVIVSSDPAIASIAGQVVVPAGRTEATFGITTGAAGTATLTLVAGDDGRELRVISGAPSPANTPPVVAAPIGVTVFEAGSAGTLFIDPGETKTFALQLIAFPSLGDLPVTAVSVDPGIASVSPGVQVIPTGASVVTLTVTATAAGDAETRIDLGVGVDRRTLRVVVGVPGDATTAIAAPVSIEVVVPSAPNGNVD